MYHIDYTYLRPKKAEALKKWYDDSFEVRQEPAVWRGNNATVLPLRRVPGDNLLFGRGGVVDENGEYVPLSAVDRRVQFSYPVEAPEYRDETVVYCGYLIDHWGHFLIEGVTRLWYFLENDPTIDKYVFFLKEGEDRQIKDNYLEFFRLLKIWDKLEIINKPTTYRQVVIPERGIRVRTAYTPKLLKVFDTIADNVQVDPSWETPEKIFCSRSQFKKGISFEYGYATLDDFFRRNGFTILFLEKVPLGQMIHYIRNAKVVAMASGSLAHNMLFSCQGQKLEILERFVLNNDNQVDINRMRELDVTYIDAHIPVFPTSLCGPVVMGYTDCMQRFAQDRGYVPPDSRYLTPKHYKQCFRHYMATYIDLHNYNWLMDDWYGSFVDSLYEGFQAGRVYFADYLDRKRPYRWYHYFTFHYWKQFVKRLLGM